MLRRPFAICLAAVALALTIFYFPWLANQTSYVAGDHNLFFEPFCRFISSQIKEGRLPLWNPFAGCGQSQAAIPSPGLFYLPNMIFVLGSYSQGVALLMLFHQLVVMYGGYLLIRELSWSRPAALLCGTSLALNGYMFTITQNWTLAATAAWVPFCLLFQLKIARASDTRRGLASAAGAALSTGLMILGGRPEIWVVGLILSGLLAVNPSGRARRISIASGLGGIACGALIAMPMIWPAAEWARISARTVKTLTSPLDWSASAYDFFTVGFGQALGDPFAIANPLHSLAQPVPGYAPFAGNFFLGPVVLTLCILALYEKNWRWKFPLITSLLLMILLTLGQNTVVLPSLLNALPALSFVRYPVKLMFFIMLLVSILAARGLESLDSATRYLRWVAAGWGLLAILGALMCALPDYSWFGLRETFLSRVSPSAASRAVSSLGTALIGWSVFIGAYFAFLKRMPKRYLSWILIGVSCVCMLLVAFAHANRSGPPDFYEARSFSADTIRTAGKGMDMQRELQLAPTPLLLPPGFQPVDAAKLALYNRQILSGNTAMDFRIGCLRPYEGAVTAELPLLESIITNKSSQYRNTFDDRIAARICQMTSTGFAVTQWSALAPDPVTSRQKPFAQPRLDPRYFTLAGEVPQLNIRVFKTKDALPYVYFANDWRWLRSRDDVLKVLNEDATYDPHKTALLLGEGASSANGEISQSGATVTFGSPFPELLLADVDAKNDGVLVFADQNYPGWTATIDGAPAKIIQANLLFKGLLLSAGKHHVELRFDPLSLRIGLFCALIGLIVAGAAFITGNRARRRQR